MLKLNRILSIKKKKQTAVCSRQAILMYNKINAATITIGNFISSKKIYQHEIFLCGLYEPTSKIQKKKNLVNVKLFYVA